MARQDPSDQGSRRRRPAMAADTTPLARGTSGAIRLSAATLHSLAPTVRVPAYRREGLVPSIVHIGVGGFHRAHQALYLDDLAALGVTREWGLRGVGLLPQDSRMEAALTAQDCLYTLVERSAEAETARVVGTIGQYIFAPAHCEQVLETLASPLTRIVSLTITEGGYNFNQVTGAFEASNPAIVADLATPGSP